MISQPLTNHQLKMNTFAGTSSRNNRRMELTPMQQNKLQFVGRNDVVHGDSSNSSPSSAANSVLELLELLTETALTPSNPRRRVKKDLKEFISTPGKEETREPLLRKYSSKTSKTEPLRTLTKTPIRDRKPPRRAVSSMQMKAVIPTDPRLTKSMRSGRSVKEMKGMRRVKSLEDKIKLDALPFEVNKEEASNCSQLDNSFFQENSSCFGDFQAPKGREQKKKREQIFMEDFGFSPFHAEPIEEQQEEPSERSCSSDEMQKHRRPSNDDSARRRRSSKPRSKKQHRKPPLRQSSAEGVVLHSSSEFSKDGDSTRRQHRKPPQRQSSAEGLVLHSSSEFSKDGDSTRRRRKNCSSAGKIRNRRTNEEYTGFFLTSPGEDNLKNGFGVSRFPDGRVFEGLYDHGEMVEGKMTYPVDYHGQTTVTTYIGKFDKDGLRYGKGIYTTSTTTFLGQFHKDDQEGSGILIYHDGVDEADMVGVNAATAGHHRRFVGHWKNSLRHGYGKEILADGTISEEGFWEKGEWVHP